MEGHALGEEDLEVDEVLWWEGGVVTLFGFIYVFGADSTVSSVPWTVLAEALSPLPADHSCCASQHFEGLPCRACCATRRTCGAGARIS